MGGHESKQTVTATTTIVATNISSATQNCVQVVVGGNTLDVSGNNNVVQDNNQSVTISVTAECVQRTVNDSNFQTNLNNKIVQDLKDKGVAGTQWLDNSKDSNDTTLTNSITTSVSNTTVQNCLMSLNGSNVINVSGNNNIVSKNTQTTAIKAISTCYSKSANASDTISDITDGANQTNDHTSDNPFAFITDAITAMAKSAMMIAGFIFVAIICFVFLFMYLSRDKRKPSYVTNPDF